MRRGWASPLRLEGPVVSADLPLAGDERKGRPQGGMKSEEGRAAYWRMQWESCIGALADLIAEHTETVAEVERLQAAVNFKQGIIDDLSAAVEHLEAEVDG
jgi:hypothetical protein